jgi:hypothetical protein
MSENEKNYNRYYIYRGYDERIIGIREYRHWYVPIRDFKYIIYDGIIEEKVMNDMYNYGWNYNSEEDSYRIVFRQQYSEYTLKNCQDETNELIIWERFENFILLYTRLYAKSSIDIMNDFYILDEIRSHSMIGSVGPLLQNLQNLNEYNYSLDDIINQELVRLEDKKNIISFINTQRHNLKKLISEKKYDEALSYIKKTHRSW